MRKQISTENPQHLKIYHILLLSLPLYQYSQHNLQQTETNPKQIQ